MLEPMTVSINEAAFLMGVCRSTILKLISQGKLETIKMGETMQARRLVKYASLKKLTEPKEEAA
jgi:excisionase family DNA binding protein